eukprot:8333029-Pyramimonas_sp.AAC.1
MVTCWHTGAGRLLHEVRMMIADFVIQLLENTYADIAGHPAGSAAAGVYGLEDTWASEPALSNVSLLFHPPSSSFAPPPRP